MNIYKWCFYIISVVFLVVFGVEVHCYNEQVSMNDELLGTLEKSREDYQSIITMWEESYDSLQTKYGKLLVQRDELQNKVDKLSETETVMYSYSRSDIQLLASCVQCEAGEGNVEAQKMITKVILNRVSSPDFPDTVYDVIYQKCGSCPQFSVAYNGMMEECEVSYEVLANVMSVIVYDYPMPEDVLYFYAVSLKEDNWVKSLPVYEEVEGTVFCYEEK